MKKIRIAFVTQFLSVGGIETRLLKLLTHIDRTRYDPVLICARDDGLGAARFKALGIPIVTTRGLLALPRPVQYLELVRLLLRQRLRRFDILLSFSATSSPFENALARTAVKSGGYLFGLVINHRMGRDQDWVVREKLAHRIISVSRNSVAGIFPNQDFGEKLKVIYNGVDLHVFDRTRYPMGRARFSVEKDTFVIGCVARLAPQKRYDVLLAALERLKKRNVRFHCLVAGQDRLDGRFQEYVASADLGGNVTYLGPVSDVPELLAACDVMALTSDNEGCPNSVLEAMATGIPVVVTRSGAEEFVVEGKTGFVVPLGDAEAVADRLQVLADDSALRTRMGANARQWIAKNASLDKMLQEYFLLFAETS